METIKERIAYLRGIIDGDASLKEERIRFLFEKMLLVLDELADDVQALARGQEELEDYLQELDFDLAFLEDEFNDGDQDFDDDSEFDWDEHENMPGSLVEVKCPQCGHPVTFDEEFLSDQGVQILCPSCDAVILETNDFEGLEDYFEEEPEIDGGEDDES